MHNPELNLQPERNLERDKQAFVEAVSSITIEEIPTTYDELAVAKLIENIENTKLFILGEMHGVKENVDVIYTLFKKFGFRQLFLEWGQKLYGVIDKFLETGEIDFEVIKEDADGRITAGHFVLIKKLKDERLLEKIVCFDHGSRGTDWDSRDEAMSRNILASLSDKLTLVIAGNLHAETKSIILRGEKGEKHPMGEHLKKEIPEVSAGNIEYLSGQFYNFGTKDFKYRSINHKFSPAKFHKRDSGRYVFELPQAHVAVVPNTEDRV